MAVARAANAIDRADTVVSLPVDVTWLADEYVGQLIAVCKRINHPKVRNLNWMGMARTLAFVTPTYLPAATYGVIGAGRKELTPRLVTARREGAQSTAAEGHDCAVRSRRRPENAAAPRLLQ